MIVPPEDEFIEEDAPELDPLDGCLEEMEYAMSVVVNGNWGGGLIMRKIGDASAEWAEKEGAEGLRWIKMWRDNSEP